MIRRLLTLLIVCLSAAFGSCRAIAPRSASISLIAESPQSLPVRFINRLILVDVRIDGREPVSFLLDTGSDVTVVDRRLRDVLALKPESSAVARGAGGTVNTTFMRGRSLDVGPLHVEDPVFLILDLASFDEITNTRVGGILGLDSLDRFALRIDYPARRVEIGRSGVFPIANECQCAFRKKENLYGIDINIGDSDPVSVLVDTGMSGSLSLEFNEAARRGVNADPNRRSEWRVGVGGGSASQVTNIPWVTFGSHSIPRVELVLAKPAGLFAGAIGGGLLRFFQLTLDFGAGVASVSDEPTSGLDLSYSNTTGARLDFRYEWIRDGIRVESVRAGTPASKAGLRAGELITSVDGQSIRSVGMRRVRELFTYSADSTQWTVSAKTGDTVRTLILNDRGAPAQGSPR
ncbi:MAG: aspartyl protease family protein [Planctomycetes bacterium]|nr:aspartyl protease family protein [Planctomycetota bacterium]